MDLLLAVAECERSKARGRLLHTSYDCRFRDEVACAGAPLAILEPSRGEGVFIGATSKYCIADNVSLAICGKDPGALKHSLQVADACGFKDVRYVEGDFVSLAISEIIQQESRTYDATVGNPPFVRYRYMESDIQDAKQSLYAVLGKKLTKHSNLWVAFAMAALGMLNPGGRLAMVIPEEISTVLYAAETRKTLERLCSKVVLVASHDRKFENTLQGFVVLMAEKNKQSRCVIFDS